MRAVVDVSRTATKKTDDDDDNSDKVRSKRGVVDNLSVISVTMAELIVTGRAFETRVGTYATVGPYTAVGVGKFADIFVFAI